MGSDNDIFKRFRFLYFFFFWYKCKYNVYTSDYTILCHLLYGLIMEENMKIIFKNYVIEKDES